MLRGRRRCRTRVRGQVAVIVQMADTTGGGEAEGSASLALATLRCAVHLADVGEGGGARKNFVAQLNPTKETFTSQC